MSVTPYQEVIQTLTDELIEVRASHRAFKLAILEELNVPEEKLMAWREKEFRDAIKRLQMARQRLEKLEEMTARQHKEAAQKLYAAMLESKKRWFEHHAKEDVIKFDDVPLDSLLHKLEELRHLLDPNLHYILNVAIARLAEVPRG